MHFQSLFLLSSKIQTYFRPHRRFMSFSSVRIKFVFVWNWYVFKIKVYTFLPVHMETGWDLRFHHVSGNRQKEANQKEPLNVVTVYVTPELNLMYCPRTSLCLSSNGLKKLWSTHRFLHCLSACPSLTVAPINAQFILETNSSQSSNKV